MKNINLLTILLLILCLFGCDKPPESNYANAFNVDGKLVFDEHESASDKSFGKIKEQHKELKILLDNACTYSEFLERKFTREKTSLENDESEVVTSVTESKIKKIPQSNTYVTCSGVKSGVVSGCVISDDNGPESKQKQYLVDLVDYLESEYAMQQGATFNEKKLTMSDDKKQKLDVVWQVIISNENIKCTKIFTEHLRQRV